MGQSDAQRDYYRRTSSGYDSAHVVPGDEHFVALEYVAGLAKMFDCTSLLDVGAGTGRALRFLGSRMPGLSAVGIEPSDDLRAQAISDGINVRSGSGEQMPFADAEFDVVLATGVMHHVVRPERVVKEMMRVCRTLLVISDANRFGQGSAPARVTKVLIHKAGLWPIFEKARTRGKGYMESEGDGIFYSYSVYDSLGAVSAWADRAFVIPTRPARPGIFGPLTESTQAMLVGVREPVTPGWAGVGPIGSGS